MKTIKNFSLFIIIIFHLHLLTGQNLIVNPNFHKKSDIITGTIDYLDGLRDFGSVDFYHSSNEKFFPWNVPPITSIGHAYPLCGDSFAGFINYYFTNILGNFNAGFEHIQFSLKEALIKDSTYQISFFIKLANSQYFSKNLGIYFSVDSNFSSCFHVRMGLYIDYVDCFDSSIKAHIEISDIQLLSDTSWTKISANYRASGGEKFMNIGVFWQENKKIIKAYNKSKNRSSIRWINNQRGRRFAKVMKRELLEKNPNLTPPTTQWGLNSKEKGAYYFIDCVSVKLIE